MRLNLFSAVIAALLLCWCDKAGEDMQASDFGDNPCSAIVSQLVAREYGKALTGEWGVFLNFTWEVSGNMITVENYAEAQDFPRAKIVPNEAGFYLEKIPEPQSGKLIDRVAIGKIECSLVEGPYDDGGSQIGLRLFGDVEDGYYDLMKDIPGAYGSVCYIVSLADGKAKKCG